LSSNFSSSSVMTTIKLQTVIYERMKEICEKKGIDFNDFLVAIIYFTILFNIDVDGGKGGDRRSYYKAIDAWIKLHQTR